MKFISIIPFWFLIMLLVIVTAWTMFGLWGMVLLVLIILAANIFII